MSSADLYIEAADILKRTVSKEATLKRLVLQSHYKNLKVLYALVCKAVQNRQALESIMKKIGVDQCSLYTDNYFLCLCLAFDIFYGEGVSCGVGERDWDEFIQRCRVAKLTAGKLSDLMPSTQSDDHFPKGPPKYLRINTLKTNRGELKQMIADNGFYFARNTYSAEREEYSDFLDVIEKQLGPEEYTNDMHMRCLFVFAPNTDLHECDFILSSKGVIQDKASTLAAPVLAPHRGSTVVDCCAAPGNKTSHLAALLENTGKLFAFDRDRKRVSVMQGLLRRRGVTNCEVECRDFLQVNYSDSTEPAYNAEYLLVDPSCSGSGMFYDVGRMLDDCETTNLGLSEERIEKLANFQAMLLNHAMCFPKAKRVVYSTCSIHERENEYVVAEMLQKWKGTYRLVTVWPEIPSRGHTLDGSFNQGVKCLRLGPSDKTTGFFVACFERVL